MPGVDVMSLFDRRSTVRQTAQAISSGLLRWFGTVCWGMSSLAQGVVWWECLSSAPARFWVLWKSLFSTVDRNRSPVAMYGDNGVSSAWRLSDVTLLELEEGEEVELLQQTGWVGWLLYFRPQNGAMGKLLLEIEYKDHFKVYVSASC